MVVHSIVFERELTPEEQKRAIDTISVLKIGFSFLEEGDFYDDEEEEDTGDSER